MEVFFQEDPLARGPAGNGLGEDASAFFTFQNTQQRDMTISTLLEQLGGQHGAAASAGLLLEADSLWLQRVTTAWQVSLIFFSFCNSYVTLVL
jgi:factor associated with neutral sphingomyelinase activation